MLQDLPALTVEAVIARTMTVDLGDELREFIR